MAISLAFFSKVSDLVIDMLEGGYYHPHMLHDGTIKYNSLLESSGETMFGLDRKNGSILAAYPAWNKFWSFLDSQGAYKNWHYDYRGGKYEAQLKKYVDEIMFAWYNELSKYFSSASRAIVESDERLLFNFIYAAWNGAGWFQRWADLIDDAVAKGNTNKDSLLSIVIKARTGSSNKLIRDTGIKIEQIVKTLSSTIGTTIKNNKGGIATVVAIALLGTAAYYYFDE